MTHQQRFEIDHIFIRASEGAPEAQHLVDLGLTEGPANVHPGQGTANRRFFFNNLMLELLWVADNNEVKNSCTSPLRLWERLHNENNTNSPFGIALRPTSENESAHPFNGREYKPQYLPAEWSILYSHPVDDLVEPFLFYLSFAKRQEKSATPFPRTHEVGFSEVTSITLSLPGSNEPSEALRSLTEINGFSMREGKYHSIEIGFDHEQHQQSRNFYPHLPLIFKW